MGGFYRVDFQGRADQGAGALAIANGKVAGLDVADGIYRGTYTEVDGRLKGTATLTFERGAELVTGMRVPPGAAIPIPFDIPASALAGFHDLAVSVAGRPVVVRLTRIADL